MLDHLGEPEAAAAIVAVTERSPAEASTCTPDHGGKPDTMAAGEGVAAVLD